MAGNCARCNKEFKDWLPPMPSIYGEAQVCDGCYVQEHLEVHGTYNGKKLQFPEAPYSGKPYWKV